jgi:hypothetical protein
MKPVPFIMAVFVATSAFTRSAAESLEPAIDEPLRNASVCRGPNGIYYLTGTTAVEGKGGGPDFHVTWSTDWTGSYDAIYRYADRWDGPYRGAMRILPYGGNGKFFQTAEGEWFYAYFPNSNEYMSRGQNVCRMNMYPVFIGMEHDELIIEPKAVRTNRAWLNQRGMLWQRQ